MNHTTGNDKMDRIGLLGDWDWEYKQDRAEKIILKFKYEIIKSIGEVIKSENRKLLYGKCFFIL